MTRSGAKGHRVAAIAMAACLGLASIAHAQLFRPFSDHRSGASRGQLAVVSRSDGNYAERVYDGKWAGLPPFELHMGPFHEFALYRGIQDEHRDHGSADNLLKPHVVEIRANAARQTGTWTGFTSKLPCPADRARTARAGT